MKELIQKTVDLFASIPDFLVRMQAAKFIPHTDMERYPSIKARVE